MNLLKDNVSASEKIKMAMNIVLFYICYNTAIGCPQETQNHWNRLLLKFEQKFKQKSLSTLFLRGIQKCFALLLIMTVTSIFYSLVGSGSA